jgi:glycosyltransferase involved in cell wall biosynthesis
MKIEIIGARGYPFSYASAEDMVREFSPRLIRDGHQVTVHSWADYDESIKGVKSDTFNGVKRVFHKTPGGKISGQFLVALKSSIFAARSDCDIVFYIFVNSAIFSWIPKFFGKKIFVNIDGIMWKDPKWPKGIRHIFFPLASYLSIFIGKAITDSYHMQQLYKKKFKVNIDWIGYGCNEVKNKIEKIDLCDKYPDGYYIIMSRITPHNLTDIMVDGFLKSKTKSHLIIAGHTPNSTWFDLLKRRADTKRVTFLGLVKDQAYLTQLLLNAKAYLHGHSLGGINPALVRVTGNDIPVICIDTVFNREVVEYPNQKLQACVFQKNSDSVADAIHRFEADNERFINEARSLGVKVRENMSWESIYLQYKKHFEELMN